MYTTPGASVLATTVTAGGLAATGAPIAPLVWLGLGFLVVGALLLRAARLPLHDRRH